MENSKRILTYKDAVDYYNSQYKINEIEKIALEKIKRLDKRKNVYIIDISNGYGEKYGKSGNKGI